MNLINDLIGAPLGYLMYWSYIWVGNYGVAILLFTLLTKVVLFPFSIIAQKNSIKMVRMAPELEDIRRYNSGNGELIALEARALYRREQYSPVAGVLPLLVQIPVILGLISVIYNPLQHLLHLNSQVIAGLTARASELADSMGSAVSELGFAGQAMALDEIRLSPGAFSDITDAAPAVQAVSSLNMDFFGLNLSAAPSFAGISVIIPFMSAISALALCLVQNKFNVLQRNSGFAGKWGMTIFLVAFSSYFAAVLPGGLGLYWTASNLLSIPVLGICNLVYNPKKYVDYEMPGEKHKRAPGEKAEKAAIREREKALKQRSKGDMLRFFDEGNVRELVFYSEANGFYKYFKGYIEYILANSDIVVHYVTSDPDDRIFGSAETRIKPYYINEKDLIKLFMRMDADVFVMTTPDIGKYHLKRSLVRKDVEYVYTDHHMTSLHMVLREGALDHYDTVFLSGPNRADELRQTEYVYGLPQKNLVETGYALLDELIERAGSLEREGALERKESSRKKILVAPSWQRGNLLDNCLEELVGGLSGRGWDVTIRPHPEFVKRFPDKMEKIKGLYGGGQADKGVRLETDFSSNESVYTADIVVTDWSTIAQEYSYSTKRPSVFVNTPMKISNPNYKKIPLVPLDISLRDEIGVSVDLADVGSIGEVCESLLNGKEDWHGRISKIVEQNIFNIGHGAENGAVYIIGRVERQRGQRGERGQKRQRQE